MAIAFVASATNTSVGTPLTITKPTGVAENDVMVAVVEANSTTPTAPAGWSEVVSPITPSGVSSSRFAVWIKRAGGSEGASYDFTLTGASFAAGGIAAYRGVSTVTAQDVTPVSNNSASVTTIDAPSVDIVTGGAMLLAIFGSVGASTFSQPSGMTERFDVNTGTLFTVSLNEQLIGSTGATGVRSTTWGSTANVLIGLAMALRPLAVPNQKNLLLMGVG